MSRAFVSASNQSLLGADGSNPISAWPVTFSIWFNPTQNTIVQPFFSLGDINSEFDYWELRVRGDSGGDPIDFEVREDISAPNTLATINGYSIGTWQHAAAVSSPTGNILEIWLDNIKNSIGDGTETPDAVDTIAIGQGVNSTPQYFDGLLAEAGVWNIQLNDDEITLLSQGHSPQAIRPENLVFYLPMINDDDIDLIGGIILSPQNSPIVNESHPIIIYPTISNIQINEGIGDSEEADDGTGFDSGSNFITIEASVTASIRKNSAFRFTNVVVPNGIKIISAVMYIQAVDTIDDDMSATIYGENVDDSVDFTTNPKISNRQKTDATISWDIDSAGTDTIVSPDISTIIQEIINRAGWVSGNAITMIVKGKTTGSKKFKGKSYEVASSSSTQARLLLEYKISGITPINKQGLLRIKVIL